MSRNAMNSSLAAIWVQGTSPAAMSQNRHELMIGSSFRSAVGELPAVRLVRVGHRVGGQLPRRQTSRRIRVPSYAWPRGVSRNGLSACRVDGKENACVSW